MMATKQLIAAFFAVCVLTSQAATAQEWVEENESDPMTGETTYQAFSQWTKPLKPMDFPYNDVEALLSYSCSKASDYEGYVGFGFTVKPNLRNTDTKDGYDLITTRVKVDDTIRTETFFHGWGGNWIFPHGQQAVATTIMDFSKGKTYMLELSWHGEGSVYFQWDLSGAAKAIERIRAKCGKQ